LALFRKTAKPVRAARTGFFQKHEGWLVVEGQQASLTRSSAALAFAFAPYVRGGGVLGRLFKEFAARVRAQGAVPDAPTSLVPSHIMITDV
jgi:hypothetical protein